jgi:hypothetical protein
LTLAEVRAAGVASWRNSLQTDQRRRRDKAIATAVTMTAAGRMSLQGGITVC